MKFIDLAKQRFDETHSVLCVGLDPVYELIPVKKSTIDETICNFLYEIIDTVGGYALAVKPNSAFFEQYGIEGFCALKKVIKYAKEKKLLVILDAKRGDIGNTSKAYAKSAFEDFGAHSITLAPYMGHDSLSPFFDYKDKGFFVLARTSNPGSKDFQLLKTESGKYLYEHVITSIINWQKDYEVTVGAVAGATHIEEFKNIVSSFSDAGYNPLLIPGIGKQGGNLEEVLQTLAAFKYPMYNVFINSSSKILYAYKEQGIKDYLQASLNEVNSMLDCMKKVII